MRFFFLIFFLLIDISSKGQTFDWATSIETSAARGNDITTDQWGNVYSLGLFDYQADFDPDTSEYLLGGSPSNAIPKVYVQKLNSDGEFVWAKSFGCYNDLNQANSIVVDSLGNVYIAGYVECSTDFDGDPSTAYTSAPGFDFSFLLKLDSVGDFVWVKKFGGEAGGQLGAVLEYLALDTYGNVYATGHYWGTIDFDPSSNNFAMTSSNSSGDVFVLKLESSGGFEWVKSLGGEESDISSGIGTDASGNVVVLGEFEQEMDADPGAGVYTLPQVGNGSGSFLVKLDSLGDFVWGRYNLGDEIAVATPPNGRGNALSINSTGDIYITGRYGGGIGPDTMYLDPLNSTDYFSTESISCAFFQKWSESGALEWSRKLYGSNVSCKGLSTDIYGNLYGTGYFSFNVFFGEDTLTPVLTSQLHPRIFFVKINSEGNLIWDTQIGGNQVGMSYSNAWGHAITVSNQGDIFTTGMFFNPLDCDPGPGTYLLNGAGNHHALVHKLCSCNGFSSYENQYVDLCHGDSLYAQGEYQQETGVFYDTIVSIEFECYDTLFLTTYLNISDSAYLDIRDTVICEGSALWLENDWQTESGVFYDTIHSILNCDSIIVKTHLTVQESIELDLGPDLSLCEGEVYTLNPAIPDAIYEWQDTSTDSTFIISESGTYWLEVTVGACTARDTIEVNYFALPEFDFPEDTLLCEGDILELNATTLNANYYWQDGNTGSVYIVEQAGIYWVDVFVPGCGNYIDSISVNYYKRPNPDLGNDTILCEGETLLLDVSGESGTYLWQDGSSNSTYLVENSGQYTVAVSNEHCTGIDTIEVVFHEIPDFTISDTLLCEGEVLSLTYTDTTVDYLWQDGSTNNSYIISTEGDYSLQQSNSCGSHTEAFTVNINPCLPELTMPNVFSPNGDEINDIFHPVHIENIAVTSIAIYDRWGIECHFSEEPEVAWDGRNKDGEEVSGGVYFWILKYTKNGNGKVLTEKGTVQLMR